MAIASRLAKFATLAPVIIAFPMSLTACNAGDSASPGTQISTAAPTSTTSVPETAAPRQSERRMPDSSDMSESSDTGAAFGPGCSAMPTSGQGSFDGMSPDRVATAASNNPMLSTLVTAAKTAGLVDTLNNAEDITVFAPTNDAFESMDEVTLTKVMTNPQTLAGVLTGHVVEGRLTPAELAGEHQTLNKDAQITVTGSGEDFTVNGKASVICGNVQTANATVYIIDEVLLPAS